jgi:hypothetical protein
MANMLFDPLKLSAHSDVCDYFTKTGFIETKLGNFEKIFETERLAKDYCKSNGYVLERKDGEEKIIWVAFQIAQCKDESCPNEKRIVSYRKFCCFKNSNHCFVCGGSRIKIIHLSDYICPACSLKIICAYGELTPCSFDDIRQVERIEELEEKIRLLETQNRELRLLPGAPDYLEAKLHFEQLASS